MKSDSAVFNTNIQEDLAKKLYKKPEILSAEVLEVVAVACGHNAKAPGNPTPDCFKKQNS